jgi:hypothetical protein
MSYIALTKALRMIVRRGPGIALLATSVLALTVVAGCGSSVHSQSSGSSAGSAAQNNSASSATGASSLGVHAGRSKHAARTRRTPTPPAELARFESRVSLAAGTFHQYVYTPFKSRQLRTKAAMMNASAAAMASFNDVLQGKQAATGGTAVRSLFASLASLSATLNQIATRLHHGHADASDIRSANGAFAGLELEASAAHVKITERAPTSLQ